MRKRRDKRVHRSDRDKIFRKSGYPVQVKALEADWAHGANCNVLSFFLNKRMKHFIIEGPLKEFRPPHFLREFILSQSNVER
jgi:hypothetical protein